MARTARAWSMRRNISERPVWRYPPRRARRRRSSATTTRSASAKPGDLVRQAFDLLAGGRLSQPALAMDAGLHQYVISKIENGQVDLRLGTIDKLARALGVRPRDLFEE